MSRYHYSGREYTVGRSLFRGRLAYGSSSTEHSTQSWFRVGPFTFGVVR